MRIKFTISVHPIPWRRAGRRGERYFTHTKVAEYQEEVIAAFLEAYGATLSFPAIPKTGRRNVALKLSFHRADNRRPDLDNLEKAVMDALEGYVWENDRQIGHKVSEVFDKEENPRVEVEAWEIAR